MHSLHSESRAARSVHVIVSVRGGGRSQTTTRGIRRARRQGRAQSAAGPAVADPRAARDRRVVRGGAARQIYRGERLPGGRPARGGRLGGEALLVTRFAHAPRQAVTWFSGLVPTALAE